MRKSRSSRSSHGQALPGVPQARKSVARHQLPSVGSPKFTMDCSTAYTYTADAAYPTTLDGLNDDTAYQSSAQIQAWADIVDEQLPGLPKGVTVPNDGMWSIGASQFPGTLSHSNSSDGSGPMSSIPMQRNHSSTFHGHATDMNSLSQSGSSTGFPITGFGGFSTSQENQAHMDINYPLDGRPYPSPIETDVQFSYSPHEQSFYPGDGRSTGDAGHGYLISTDTQNMRPGPMDDPYYQFWNGSGVDSSVSPSLSSHLPGTPTSLALDDSTFVNGSSELPASIIPVSDAQSTVRPVQGSQRMPLPDTWMQSPLEIAGPVYGSPISTFPSSRRSSDGEPLSARRHHLYQLKPRKDGFYKCVFLDDGKACDHDPFKLKCNYDKHLDSHLKPYRCKQRGCAENPFSSTACLLRHEREAHGMHNHKEVLCRFKECDRSLPGKGFPRKWNAHDHMKRVHRYTAPEDEASSTSSSSPDMPFSEAPAFIGSATSKRRTSNTKELPGSSTTRKTKSSGKSARGESNATTSSQGSRGQSYLEQVALADRRCSQTPYVTTNWNSWHQPYQTTM